MNTRKKCNACGLITFASDEVCKRCGSDKLFKYAMPEDLPLDTEHSPKNNLPFWSYLVCFVLACVFECVALFPVLANIGWRHSSRAPKSEFEINSEFAAFMLHLPTSILIWLLKDFFIVIPLIFSAPIIQIIFWTFILTKFWRWMNNLYKLK